MRCPVCNTENPDVAKFCLNCGNRMPERKTTGTSERKVVTVLFCDVKGSTALAEKLDPEDWTEVIDGAFRILTPPIQRYGGTVARLLGDAVLAFFGAPVAHEDDPERAVRAGLEMLQATQAYRQRLVGERGAAFEGFDIRIGINTGLAVIGDVGTGQSVEYTGMGDAVNVAARMQSLAEPGQMLVADRTFRELPAVFEWEPAGEVDVKGRDAKVSAFIVRGLSATATIRARPRVIAAPLVGRETELGVLRDALEEIRRGGGRIVSLVGDAGLGKTRLIEELRAEWEAQPVEGQRWSEARGQSYEQTRPYGLFRQHLLSLAGLTDADPNEMIRERVVALLPEERRRDQRALRALDAFLAVDPEGAPGPEGQELRTEAHAVVRELVQALGMCQVVLVFDDLQWGDAASADLLMELFDLADEAPILFLCAFRPDRQASSWRVKQRLETDFPHRYTELDLKPLTDQESELFLAHALPGAGVSAQLRKRIREKGDGNPFFLEEIVRGLIDDGTVVRDESGGWRVTRADAEIRLPESLQKVLAARIDRLGQEQRETLQAAAVIGRTFQFRVLEAIREATDKLDRQLRELQRLELVRESAREPEREYAFRHALTQEAAYGSILQRKRRELHIRVAEALVALFAERAEELSERIGHHFAEALDPRAVRYLKIAGERAQRINALDEAETHFRRAMSLLRRDRDDAETVTDLYLRYGRVFELRGDYATALETYRDLERVARERHDAGMEGAALAAQLVIHSNPTPFLDPARANEIIARQIGLARERGDRKLEAKLLWNKAQAEFWRGDDTAALGAAQESAAIAREIGDTEQLAFTLNSLGQGFSQFGRVAEAEAPLRESIALFEELGNKPMQADGWSTLAFTKFFGGDLDAAEESGMRAYEIADSVDNDWGRAYGLFTPSFVRTERGEWGPAIDIYERAIAYAQKGGFLAGEVASASDVGYLYAVIGAADRSREHHDHAIAFAREKFPVWRHWPLAQAARAAVILGDLERAGGLIAELADYVPTMIGDVYMGSTVLLARAEHALASGDGFRAFEAIAEGQKHVQLRSLLPLAKDFDLAEGRAQLTVGDLPAARAALERGIASSRMQRSVRVLWQLLGLLARIHDVEGRPDEARRSRDEAARIVETIASTLRQIGLEELFLARPAVREAVGRAGVL